MTDPDESIAALIPPEPAATSSYVVLAENGTARWDETGDPIAARDAKHAIKQVVEAMAEGDRSGTYVAIPARSWQPVTITARVEHVVRLEGL